MLAPRSVNRARQSNGPDSVRLDVDAAAGRPPPCGRGRRPGPRGVRPRGQARRLPLARPRRRRLRHHAARRRSAAGRRRVPDAPRLDQVRGVLLRRRTRAGAITSAINLRLGPAEQASIVGRTDPVVTVVGDGATVPDGVDPGHVVPVEDLKEAFGAGAPRARAGDRVERPGVPDLDERHHRHAQGRDLHPRRDGHDRPQHRRLRRHRTTGSSTRCRSPPRATSAGATRSRSTA